jgi:NADH dehydrogenase
MAETRDIVIVGGGFAGTTLARALEQRLPAGWQVVLLSEESYTTFNPMLAEVVGASVFPEHVVAPIRQMLRSCRFVMGRVTSIDLARRTLHASTLAGPRQFHYEHLVLAFGNRANLNLVPGLAEHALPLKLIGDALFIRNRVLQRVARIELESDPQVRRQLGRFIVIGGGFSGVEVAGGLADFLASVPRYYPRVAPQELQVTLLQDTDRLLPELPQPLGRAAEASLRARRVDVRLKARATRVDAGGVLLDDGATVPGATVICTIGTQPNPLAQRLGLPLQRGRVVTAPDLSVPAAAGVWAIGDCALVRNHAVDPGAIAPPTAQFAIAQATLLAANLSACVAQQPTRPFGHVSRGMMATTGHLRGVALLAGMHLTGLPAWLVWRAYYLLRMPTLGRKVRIWVEWTWGMFFAADITHLRFTRTGAADVDGDGDSGVSVNARSDAHPAPSVPDRTREPAAAAVPAPALSHFQP